MLAIIVVCEWSYLCWGQNVLPTTKRDDFECFEWVDLHSGPYFESVVAYFRRLLDEQALTMTREQLDKCTERFLETVQLEEDFFNSVYSDN